VIHEVNGWEEDDDDLVVGWCECDPPPIPDEEHENRCAACGLMIARDDPTVGSPHEG
jgi:hypothetical protein